MRISDWSSDVCSSDLWVLAIGALLAFAVEFTLRLARSTLLDDLGRDLDVKLSEKIFSKVLNMPLADRRGSTGMLARRVSEFESVRDFFASTDRQRVVWGKSVSVRVDLGGRRLL